MALNGPVLRIKSPKALSFMTNILGCFLSAMFVFSVEQSIAIAIS